MAAPSGWIIYDQFLLALGKKEQNLNADSFKVALFASTSDCGNKAHANAQYSLFTNELATANGYTVGGATAGTGAFTNSSGTLHFDVPNVSWTASGAGITARYAVVYNNTDASKRAVAYCVLDNTPADLVTPSGIMLSLLINDVFTALAA